MTILVLKLPDVKRKTEERPKECPYCNGETFQRWGRVRKPVKDTRCRNVCSVSVSLLPVWADLQALSGRDKQGRSNGAAAAVCGDLLDIGIELSRREHDPEWLEDRIMSDDGVAGCPGAGREAQETK